MRYGRSIAGGNCAWADALGTPNAHSRAGLCCYAKSRATPHTHLPIASLLVLVLIAGTVRAETAPNIVLRWNNALLEAVRNAHLGPPMVARALAVVHTCMYDSWAAYDDRAAGTQLGDRLRQPWESRTTENKTAAISYAAYRAASDLFPNDARLFKQLMAAIHYDPSDISEDTATPAGVGNVACKAVLEFRHHDGANQLGDEGSATTPYSDYTGYAPLNQATALPVDASKIRDPDRFQPLYYKNVAVREFYPLFVGAHWFRVVAFSGGYDEDIAEVIRRFPLLRHGTEEFERQARELVDISAHLTDKQKMISEYWSDGPNSELPPGHWCLLAQFVSRRDHHTLDDDVKMFFVLTNALFDAGVASWTAKRRVDSVRPITAVPNLLKGQPIESWAGSGKGTGAMDGEEWLPYQPDYLPTPPFPEYPSGHSTFSAAGARILQLWTGNDQFGGSVTFGLGSSKIEPGHTPQSVITLRWPTFTAAADEAGMSRRYGGIHFEHGDLAGRTLGRLVADKVWQKAALYFTPE